MECNDNLTVSELVTIDNIIKKFDWIRCDLDRNIFRDRFIDLFRRIHKDDRWLIYELSSKLVNITINNYPLYCKKIVNDISSELGYKPSQIYLVPILKSEDKYKIKSGHSIAYFMKSIFDILYGHEISAKINILSDVSFLKKGKKRLIIFCDTFIGAGGQAAECLNRYFAQYRQESDIIAIATIVILRSGLKRLTELGYKVFYCFLHSRGISDDPKLCLCNAINTMKRIEQQLNISEKYSLGSSQSEALLAFDSKAPNNTFPIYWLAGKSKLNTVFYR